VCGKSLISITALSPIARRAPAGRFSALKSKSTIRLLSAGNLTGVYKLVLSRKLYGCELCFESRVWVGERRINPASV